MDTLQGSIFQNETEIEWENAGPGIERQIFGYDDKIMMVKVKFEKDAVGSLHQHPHSQVTFVASGVFEFTIGEEKRLIKKGDGCYVPPNVLHGTVCREEGLLIDVFSPVRQDFLTLK